MLTVPSEGENISSWLNTSGHQHLVSSYLAQVAVGCPHPLVGLCHFRPLTSRRKRLQRSPVRLHSSPSADFPGSVKGPYPSLVGEEPQGVALEALLGETALARFAQSAESVRVATSMFPPRKPSHLLHRTPFPSGCGGVWKLVFLLLFPISPGSVVKVERTPRSFWPEVFSSETTSRVSTTDSTRAEDRGSSRRLPRVVIPCSG